MIHWIIHHGNMKVLQKNKRVQTFKMVFQYIYIFFFLKKRGLCQTNILPFVEFYGSQNKEKKTLEMYNLFSSYQIYYLFPPSFALTF